MVNAIEIPQGDQLADQPATSAPITAACVKPMRSGPPAIAVKAQTVVNRTYELIVSRVTNAPRLTDQVGLLGSALTSITRTSQNDSR
jgi:hypothetical protein